MKTRNILVFEMGRVWKNTREWESNNKTVGPAEATYLTPDPIQLPLADNRIQSFLINKMSQANMESWYSSSNGGKKHLSLVKSGWHSTRETHAPRPLTTGQAKTMLFKRQ